MPAHARSGFSSAETELTTRWLTLAESVDAPTAAIDQLLTLHREPHRRYHTAKHVLALLRHLDSIDTSLDPAPRLAAFYHDAIHETANHTGDESNEELSAQLAELELATCDAHLVDRVAALIRATDGHLLIDDSSAAVFLDADLAILGSSSDRYTIYTQQIREEYGHVPDDQFRTGRSVVLEDLLSRDQLYFSSDGIDRWEEPARRNMTAEIAALTASS